jgi:hypothetical protein
VRSGDIARSRRRGKNGTIRESDSYLKIEKNIGGKRTRGEGACRGNVGGAKESEEEGE